MLSLAINQLLPLPPVTVPLVIPAAPLVRSASSAVRLDTYVASAQNAERMNSLVPVEELRVGSEPWCVFSVTSVAT